MAPKKKNNKKANDDWEAELGETPVAAAEPEQDSKGAPAEADPDEEFAPAGGLMAMMRKRQKKKKAKGGDDDFLEGEDPPAAEAQPDLSEKAPVEASIDDEFALPEKKGKAKSGAKSAPVPADDEDDETGADGKVLTKAQKEKLKKEREKQRKKENVGDIALCVSPTCVLIDWL